MTDYRCDCDVKSNKSQCLVAFLLRKMINDSSLNLNKEKNMFATIFQCRSHYVQQICSLN